MKKKVKTSVNIEDANRPHHTKIEFSKFNEGDLWEWFLKVEKYFKYYDTHEEDKVDVALIYLKGDALDLIAWINHERTLHYWDELVTAFQENFRPPNYQNPDEFLCSNKQEGSIQEYRAEFAKRSAWVRNWPEHFLLGIFLNSLWEDLQLDVRIHKPRSVYKAISLAREFETKMCVSKPRPNQF